MGSGKGQGRERPRFGPLLGGHDKL